MVALRKFWDRKESLQKASGEEAFRKKQALMGFEDRSFAGHGSILAAALLACNILQQPLTHIPLALIGAGSQDVQIDWSKGLCSEASHRH